MTLKDMRPIERYYDKRKSTEYEITRLDELWKEENEVFQRVLSRIVCEIADESESKTISLKILDLPVGTGRWIPFLQDQRVDYTGVDISDEMLRQAEDKIQSQDALDSTFQLIKSPYQEYLPTVKDGFDIVICTRFLPHFEPQEVESIIKLMAGATRKYLLIQVRVTESRFAWLSEIAYFIITARAGSIRRYKKAGRLSYSKVRSHYDAAVELTGMSVDRYVVKKDKFSSFEYWLLKKRQ